MVNATQSERHWRLALVLTLLPGLPMTALSEDQKTGDMPSVRVRHMLAVEEDPTWIGMPQWMNGARIYSRPNPDDPRPKGVSGREVLFDVTEDSTVLLLACWTYDGNRRGGWQDTRTSREQLIEQGWIPLDTVERRKKDNTLD